MPKNLYWFNCGSCGGDSVSMFNMESPDIAAFFKEMDISLLWHPSLSSMAYLDYQNQIEAILSDDLKLDILCVEGSVIRGPGGSGMYHSTDYKPRKDLVGLLAEKADYVVAVGTCASYGGICTDGEVEATGLQFHKFEKGGFLGKDFVSQKGLPVINLPGCPCHNEIVSGAISHLASNKTLELDEFNAPLEWFGMLVHQGCVRNEYHEYRVEDSNFGNKGCLFFHLGCLAPLTNGSCNKILWNRRSSKTRAGVPCVGCTQPDFPKPYPFFKTRNIADVPLDLPIGVDRAHYMAYKSMAAAAAPKRLKDRKTKI